MKKWKIGNPDTASALEMKNKSNLTYLCTKLLNARGYTNLKSAADFIESNDFRSPYEIKDMKKAADIITEAIDAGQKICIYGDYDCDGVTSTVILYKWFTEIGAEVIYYIPERSEGYGMNETSIRKLHDEDVELIVTVDNGISAINEAELIYELGMKLVITDHHEPGETLPKAEAIVDPHRQDDISFFKYFCGAGLAFKLIAAMEDGDYTIAKEEFAEISAIGTIGDVVSLTGENREIVKLGLFYLENTDNPGLLALRKGTGMEKRNLSSIGLAFSYVPRINAAGRFGSPRKAAELLLTESQAKADELFETIDGWNNSRKNEELKILDQIHSQILVNPQLLEKRVIVFYSNEWHPGVIGIVAARLVEDYGKPAYVITNVNGEARGSARSFGEFSVFKSLEYCSDCLTKYGGHKGAGGFSLDPENISKFDDMLQKFAFENFPVMPEFTLYADICLEPNEITVENIESLKILEPFGEGNPEPVFALVHAKLLKKTPISDGKHTKLYIDYGGNKFNALIFRKSPDEVSLNESDICDFLVTAEINEWNGNKSVSLIVRDYRKSGIKQSSYFASLSAYERLVLGENLPQNYKLALKPSRTEFIKIYKSFGNEFEHSDSIYQKIPEISFGKFKTAMRIFCETGLAEYNAVFDSYKKLAVKNKVDLSKSPILQKLNI